MQTKIGAAPTAPQLGTSQEMQQVSGKVHLLRPPAEPTWRKEELAKMTRSTWIRTLSAAATQDVYERVRGRCGREEEGHGSCGLA